VIHALAKKSSWAAVYRNMAWHVFSVCLSSICLPSLASLCRCMFRAFHSLFPLSGYLLIKTGGNSASNACSYTLKTQHKFIKIIIIIFPNSLIRYTSSTYNILISCVIFFEKWSRKNIYKISITHSFFFLYIFTNFWVRFFLSISNLFSFRVRSFFFLGIERVIE